MANNGSKRSKKGVLQLLRMRTTMLILLILVIGFGAVSVRIGYLTLVQGTYLQEKAVEQQLVDTTVNSKRGTIYDAKGKVLAQSASVWKVVLAPAYLETEEQRIYVAQNLAKILDLKYEDVYKKTKQKTYYVVLKRKIESDEREKILSLCDALNEKFDGLSNVITLFDDYRRYYPYNDLASSVIGFTGSDDQGLEGVEFKYDDYLTGTPGRIITARNANQTDMPFQYEQNVAAKDGNNITLTIDETVQSIAEKYMKKGITDNEVVNRGVCIIMNVNTGAIIAMVTVDGYDLNKPYDLSDADLAAIRALPEKKRAAAESAALGAMWRNKAVADTYYPGSVFKMCTASMALNEGVVNENSSFNCGGSVTIYDHTIHCHFHAGHGTQNLFQAIYNSCNPAFIDIGARVGADKFYKYYEAFGFSEPTGIDLPGESDDLFFNEDGSMSQTDLAVASFGQNFSITPIQMVTACSAIANGGKVLQPYVVQKITDSDGNVVKNTETTVKRQVISSAVSKKMCKFLEDNTTKGGVNNGYISGYRVGGKTGTSEKIGQSQSGYKDYIASFCGFAPADKPEVACLVFYDTPRGASYYGSQVSAPVFVNIMSEVLPYLEVQAEYDSGEKQYVDTITGSYSGLSVAKAEAAAKKDGFTVTVKGEGKKVISQMPSTATKIPVGGNVVLYTDKESEKATVNVPDMVGYSVSTVNDIAASAGLNISFSGVTTSANAVSKSQSISAGEKVSEGTVITVEFSGGTVVND
ncbi:MAG: penicillin-binding transpeptidase domain-containing protein [Ruminococcus sp.]|nr:penicillin-binding transpeptidase domain-containing protein [Ruminococcus sp.]